MVFSHGLCTYFGPISSLCVSFQTFFFSFLNFHCFISLSLLCLLHSRLHSHCLLSLLFLSLSLINSFFSHLRHFFLINSISTFFWAAWRGQLVGCNYPCHIQMGAGLKLLEPLKPVHLPHTHGLWERRPAHGSWLITGSSEGELQLSFFFREALRPSSFLKETLKVQLEPELSGLDQGLLYCFVEKVRSRYSCHTLLDFCPQSLI